MKDECCTIFVCVQMPFLLLTTRGVHGDGILVPSPPITADFTPIPTRPRTNSDPSPQKVWSIPQAPTYFCQPKVVITVTVVAILKIPHSAALTVNFKLWRNTPIYFYKTKQKLKAYITDLQVSNHCQCISNQTNILRKWFNVEFPP